MTAQELRFRLDMIRSLLRSLAGDLRTGDNSDTVTACTLVALDEIGDALGNLEHIYECICEVEQEVANATG